MNKVYMSMLIALLFIPLALFSMGAGVNPKFLCDENDEFVYAEYFGQNDTNHEMRVKIYFLHRLQKKEGVLTKDWKPGTERFFLPKDTDGFKPFYFIKKRKQWYKRWYKNPSPFFLKK